MADQEQAGTEGQQGVLVYGSSSSCGCKGKEPVKQGYAQLAAHLKGEGRTEVLMNREYRVVPATIVQAQVLHNNFGPCLLPPDALNEEWAEAWNHVPVILDHPRKRGVYISGRDPSVLNAAGVGYLFAVRVADNALKGEVWLQTDRTEQVPELAEILEALNVGRPVELSTGFPTRLVNQLGVHDGKKYERIMLPSGVDHLAVFTDKIGACSVADGCGLGVHETAEPEPCGCGGKEPSLREGKNAMSEEQQSEPEVQEGSVSEDEETPGWFQRFIDRFRVNVSEPVRQEADEDRRQFLAEALWDEYAKGGHELWIIAVFSEEGRVVFERWSEMTGGKLFQVNYELEEQDGTATAVRFTDAPVEVRRVTDFVPVANEDAGNQSTDPVEGEKESETMKREHIIARLEEGSCPLGRDRLTAMSDDALQALHESYEAEPAVQEDSKTASSNDSKEAAAADEGAEGVLAALNELTEAVNSLREGREQDRAEIEELKQATAPAVQEQERERDELVRVLSGNESVPFDEAELQAKSLDELRKLRSMAQGSSYTGRGGPRITPANAENELAFMPPRPYFETDAPKEAN